LKLAKRERYKSDLQDKVKGQLERKADGTFLWAALVGKELENVLLGNILSVLEELSPEMESLYKRMNKIQRLEPAKYMEFCTRILSPCINN
jgi:hypothetical protein